MSAGHLACGSSIQLQHRLDAGTSRKSEAKFSSRAIQSCQELVEQSKSSAAYICPLARLQAFPRVSEFFGVSRCLRQFGCCASGAFAAVPHSGLRIRVALELRLPQAGAQPRHVTLRVALPQAGG